MKDEIRRLVPNLTEEQVDGIQWILFHYPEDRRERVLRAIAKSIPDPEQVYLDQCLLKISKK